MFLGGLPTNGWVGLGGPVSPPPGPGAGGSGPCRRGTAPPKPLSDFGTACLGLLSRDSRLRVEAPRSPRPPSRRGPRLDDLRLVLLTFCRAPCDTCGTASASSRRRSESLLSTGRWGSGGAGSGTTDPPCFALLLSRPRRGLVSFLLESFSFRDVEDDSFSFLGDKESFSFLGEIDSFSFLGVEDSLCEADKSFSFLGDPSLSPLFFSPLSMVFSSKSNMAPYVWFSYSTESSLSSSSVASWLLMGMTVTCLPAD